MATKKKANKKAKDWKPAQPITVDRGKFEAAIDKILAHKPVPKKKIKANSKRVPQPLFPAQE